MARARVASACVWMLLALLGVAPAASQQGQQAPGRPHAAAESWIASIADAIADESPSPPGVVIAAHRLHVLFATPAGQATTRLLDDAGVFDRAEAEAGGVSLQQAWASLALQLRLAPEQAFENLLGERVLLTVADPAAPASRGWALATLVAADDIKRLVAALAPTQRNVRSGRPVFTIEDGDFLLTVFAGAPLGASKLLVIGPAAQPKPFNALVDTLATPATLDRFARDWPMTHPAGGVIARIRALGRDAFVLSASAAGDRWLGIASLPWPTDARAAEAGWSQNAADSMLDGAALALVGAIDPVAVERSPLSLLLGIAPNTLTAILGSEPRPAALRIVPNTGPPLDQPRSRPRLTTELLVRTAPGSLPIVDAAAADLIAITTGSPESVTDFAGSHPRAARTVPLRGGLAQTLADAIVGPSPVAAWTVRTDPDGARSWLAAALTTDPVPSERLLRLHRAVADHSNGPIVAAGTIAPRQLAELARTANLDRRLLRAARHVRHATWRTVAGDENLARTMLTVRMNPGGS